MKFRQLLPPWKELVFITVVSLGCLGLCLLPSAPVLTEAPAEKTVRAQVLEVDDSDLQTHGLVRYGSQRVTVKAGEKIFRADNQLRGQLELDKVFAPGDQIIVTMPPDAEPDNTVLVAKDHWRNGWSFALFGMFCVLLIIFGSWTGVKALLSFVFSCLAIWKLVIPLTLKGFSASWLIFSVVCLLTAVIIFLVSGLTKKGIAAFGGAVTGVCAGLLMAYGFGEAMHINGASMPYVQALLYSGFEKLDLQDIFIGAMILAGSGAVMDLAMDIAAGIEEVALHNPGLSHRELMMSGIRIGRSVVGTMTTTLLLAYSGGYLTLLMMFAVQGTPATDFLNNPLVAAEVVKTLIGSFSLVLVAPLTAVISGCLFGKKSLKKEQI